MAGHWWESPSAGAVDRERRRRFVVGPPLPVPSHRWVGLPLVAMLWIDWLGALPPYLFSLWGKPVLALIAAVLGTVHLFVWGRGKMQSVYFSMTIFWLTARSVSLVTQDHGLTAAQAADGVARNAVLAFLIYRLWVRRMAEA